MSHGHPLLCQKLQTLCASTKYPPNLKCFTQIVSICRPISESGRRSSKFVLFIFRGTPYCSASPRAGPNLPRGWGSTDSMQLLVRRGGGVGGQLAFLGWGGQALRRGSAAPEWGLTQRAACARSEGIPTGRGAASPWRKESLTQPEWPVRVGGQPPVHTPSPGLCVRGSLAGRVELCTACCRPLNATAPGRSSTEPTLALGRQAMAVPAEGPQSVSP